MKWKAAEVITRNGELRKLLHFFKSSSLISEDSRFVTSPDDLANMDVTRSGDASINTEDGRVPVCIP